MESYKTTDLGEIANIFSSVLLEVIDPTDLTDGPEGTSKKSPIQKLVDFLNRKHRFVAGATITGVTAETVIQTIEIPENTYTDIDAFQLIVPVFKSTTAAAMAFKLYHGLEANARTTEVANLSLTTGNRVNTLNRICFLSGGNANLNVPAVANQPSPYQAQNVVAVNFPVNPAVKNFFTIAANPTLSTESAGCQFMSIRPLKP